jgi:glutamate synthase (NADPH/NADH) small chain
LKRRVKLYTSGRRCDYGYRHLAESFNPNTTQGIETDRKAALSATNRFRPRARRVCGGDAVTGAATVILAMGAGKKAAQSIEQYILGKK